MRCPESVAPGEQTGRTLLCETRADKHKLPRACCVLFSELGEYTVKYNGGLPPYAKYRSVTISMTKFQHLIVDPLFVNVRKGKCIGKLYFERKTTSSRGSTFGDRSERKNCVCFEGKRSCIRLDVKGVRVDRSESKAPMSFSASDYENSISLFRHFDPRLAKALKERLCLW
jgi:hypothetical protein